jgi:transposase
MAIADASGFPIAAHIESASPHEVKLAEDTIDNRFLNKTPDLLIGDKAYDSDSLDQRLKDQNGIEMIAPHKFNRKKPKSQDGRKLRRYKRRWKVERLFAWLHNLS